MTNLFFYGSSSPVPTSRGWREGRRKRSMIKGSILLRSCSLWVLRVCACFISLSRGPRSGNHGAPRSPRSKIDAQDQQVARVNCSRLLYGSIYSSLYRFSCRILKPIYKQKMLYCCTCMFLKPVQTNTGVHRFQVWPTSCYRL